MMGESDHAPLIALACGGTGGHVFPGIAVGHALRSRGAEVMLLTSPKEVDRAAVRSCPGLKVTALEAAGLDWKRPLGFLAGLRRAWRQTRVVFRERAPGAVMTLGGFTGAAPLMLGRRCGAWTFIHESNAVPGRANRWLAPWTDAVFVGFGEAAGRLRCGRVRVTGTPVRPEIQPLNAGECRLALGLEPDRPTLLVTGGSQGARAINELVVSALEVFARELPTLQFLHLTGFHHSEGVAAAYRGAGARARVTPFMEDMARALGAADVAVGRAGASSIVEFAAMGLPSILVPYPFATDNHQLFNARAVAGIGGALLLEQHSASADGLVANVKRLLTDHMLRQRMRAALASWHRPGAAEEIASVILESLATGEVPIPARSRRGGLERVPRRGLPGAGDVSRRSAAGMGASGIGGV